MGFIFRCYDFLVVSTELVAKQLAFNQFWQIGLNRHLKHRLVKRSKVVCRTFIPHWKSWNKIVPSRQLSPQLPIGVTFRRWLIWVLCFCWEFLCLRILSGIHDCFLGSYPCALSEESKDYSSDFLDWVPFADNLIYTNQFYEILKLP